MICRRRSVQLSFQLSPRRWPRSDPAVDCVELWLVLRPLRITQCVGGSHRTRDLWLIYRMTVQWGRIGIRLQALKLSDSSASYVHMQEHCVSARGHRFSLPFASLKTLLKTSSLTCFVVVRRIVAQFAQHMSKIAAILLAAATEEPKGHLFSS